MAYSGTCNCGAVQATITGEAAQTRQCWCRQCRKLASGGAAQNTMFRTSEVSLSGAVTSWSYTAASGNTLTQHFCASCGTPVYAQSSARPQFMTFRLGFLDEPHGLAPEMAIWTSEKPDWAILDPGIPHFAEQPPAPATQS
ncbi:GFA family protein [Altericroceibacterium xinjiangense]|uniref:GFA family protein n=1 Tax=Altericroceibacterium xinjiangense TaxID=762261 RepID=UPI000F7F40C4|nr:GFA family protein [Altericroceibacterium xinjiangense]